MPKKLIAKNGDKVYSLEVDRGLLKKIGDSFVPDVKKKAVKKVKKSKS